MIVRRLKCIFFLAQLHAIFDRRRTQRSSFFRARRDGKNAPRRARASLTIDDNTATTHLPGNVQLVQRRSHGFGSERHGPSDVQQRVADDHVPRGDVRGAGPLGHALPPDQPAAVASVPPPQHGHRVQPVLLTVAAGHDALWSSPPVKSVAWSCDNIATVRRTSTVRDLGT